MSEAEGSIDYSTTNVQVEGVDEADVVKTDGKYIYQINNNRVVVSRHMILLPETLIRHRE